MTLKKMALKNKKPRKKKKKKKKKKNYGSLDVIHAMLVNLEPICPMGVLEESIRQPHWYKIHGQNLQGQLGAKKIDLR